MHENQTRDQTGDREQAIEAVRAANNLQESVNDKRRRIKKLTEKADEAEQSGDEEKAKKLRHDCDREEELIRLEAQLGLADEITEQSKRDIAREAIELKAQWKVSQLPARIDMHPFDTLFGCAVVAWLLLIALIFFGGKIVSQLNF